MTQFVDCLSIIALEVSIYSFIRLTSLLSQTRVITGTLVALRLNLVILLRKWVASVWSNKGRTTTAQSWEGQTMTTYITFETALRMLENAYLASVIFLLAASYLGLIAIDKIEKASDNTPSRQLGSRWTAIAKSSRSNSLTVKNTHLGLASYSTKLRIEVDRLLESSASIV